MIDIELLDDVLNKSRNDLIPSKIDNEQDESLSSPSSFVLGLGVSPKAHIIIL